MNILFLLLPALGWGLLPPVVAKIGGKPANQILGTTAGLLLVGSVVSFFTAQIDTRSFLLAALAGAFWVIGQIGQFIGYQKIGVSTTMPISTGLQLIGTSLIGVVLFGEWSTSVEKIAGLVGIVLLIIGITLTAFTENQEKQQKDNLGLTLLVLVLTTIGFCIYEAIPKGLASSGIAIFFPESLGMFVAAVLYLLFSRQTVAFKEKTSWKNILGGLIFSLAATSYIYSVHDNGVNSAFIASQLSVVISTLGGILVMHEKKTSRELIYTILGLILIVSGAVITSIF